MTEKSKSRVSRIPYARAIGVVIVLFGLYNIWAVNAGLWSMLYWMPWAFGYANPPAGAGLLERAFYAVMAFIGALWGLLSGAVKVEPVRFVVGGLLPAVGGVGLLIAHRLRGDMA